MLEETKTAKFSSKHHRTKPTQAANVCLKHKSADLKSQFKHLICPLLFC